jgi:hypothetical protein
VIEEAPNAVGAPIAPQQRRSLDAHVDGIEAPNAVGAPIAPQQRRSLDELCSARRSGTLLP